jgi:DNA phosphorothioation-associated putative methyltransferase
MTSAEYSRLVAACGTGKVLPEAVYLHTEALAALGGDLFRFIAHLWATTDTPESFNVVKLFRREFKVSFLEYPDFFGEPHPVLARSRTIDLATGRVRDFNYQDRDNPPILHRKETLLPPGHADIPMFTHLTEAEEEAGLYEDTTSIGFKRNWDRLLVEKGLGYRGHRLVQVSDDVQDDDLTGSTEPAGDVSRHRTAISRNQLSRPIKVAIEHGLLTKDRTLFDYGCGLGDDVRFLGTLGYTASGWDPAYCPDNVRSPADVVNLGFVLNVIEDAGERVAALREAFGLAREVLLISTILPNGVGDSDDWEAYADGVLTSRNTFQKYFSQDELRQFLEDVLHTTAFALGLGIFCIFRDPRELQSFLAGRSRRSINWDRLSLKLRPRRRGRKHEYLYIEHKELLESFWDRMLDLGRLPRRDEFGRFDEVRAAVGSIPQAREIFVQKHGEETFTAAFEMRQADWTVYLALANLRRRVPFRHLPQSHKRDIKTFFGSYTDALEAGREMLFMIGDPDIIEEECQAQELGWQDEQALYVHSELVDQLSVILRIYVGCAELLFGDIHEVDIVKIHKRSGKVTFLVYDDFERKRLPELVQRVKINLRTQEIDVFGRLPDEDVDLLYFKDRYVSPDHPKLRSWRRFSGRLRKVGIDESRFLGVKKSEFAALAAEAGLTPGLSPISRRG